MALPTASVMPAPTVHVMFLAVTAVPWTLPGVPSVTMTEVLSAESTMVDAKVVVALT